MRAMLVSEVQTHMKDPHTIDIKLRNDYCYMRELLVISPSAAVYECTSDALKMNDDFIIDIIYSNDEIVQFMKDRHNDKKIAIELIAMKSRTIRYFSKLLNNKEFILSYLPSDPFLAQFMSDRLRADRDIGLACQSPFAFRELSETLRDDIEIVENILSVDAGGRAYEWFSQRMKDNRDLTICAVSSWGFALSFAGKYQKDETVVLEAMRSSRFAIRYSKLKSHDTVKILLRDLDSEIKLFHWHILRYPELRLYRTYKILREIDSCVVDRPYLLELKALPNAVDYLEAKERFSSEVEKKRKD
jgi:hypothetical protein